MIHTVGETERSEGLSGDLGVYFGGVLAEYGFTATVEADGTFSLTEEIPDLEGGVASAQTYDWSLNPSNLAQCYVLAWD